MSLIYNFGDDPDKEWNVDSIVSHKHTSNSILFDVQWDTGETTRELYNNCKELEALDRYLELHGIKHWCELPKKAKAPNKKTRHSCDHTDTNMRSTTTMSSGDNNNNNDQPKPSSKGKEQEQDTQCGDNDISC